jgi:FkbM family methyltransferase
MTQLSKTEAEAQQAQIESTLPDLFRGIGKFARRAARSIKFRSRTALGRFGPRMISRNVLYPMRNVVLGNRPLTVRAGGQTFVLRPEGAVPMEMWSSRYFEVHELEFVLEMLQPGMTFLDVGANVGLFTIPAAKKVGQGKVFAFEPTSWTFERLKNNASLNGLKNVCLTHCAIGDAPGEANLQVNVHGKDGLNTIGRSAHEQSEVIGTERIEVMTLDGFLRAQGVDHVDVIKIDTEGAELSVLRGAAHLLAREDAPLIVYEAGFLSKGFGYHPVESMWFLKRKGYQMFVMHSGTGKIVEPAHQRAYDANVIAVKPEHEAFAAIRDRAR